MAMVGMVLLAGTVVNNGIVGLNRVFQLMREGRTREEASRLLLFKVTHASTDCAG